MGNTAVKHRYSFNKVRLSLFVYSYAAYSISSYIQNKYNIDNRLAVSKLKRLFGSKRSIPEISRLSRIFGFSYQLLWNFIVIGKTIRINPKIKAQEKVKVYLDIENELILLAVAKQNKSDYTDPDYESESALLSIAIERAAGNALRDVDDDSLFRQRCEEIQKQYLYWYYKVAYRYKLPTIRIIPFVLRLIMD